MILVNEETKQTLAELPKVIQTANDQFNKGLETMKWYKTETQEIRKNSNQWMGSKNTNIEEGCQN